jgi:hypothetical protein
MRRLYRAADLPEAQLLIGLLATAGIEARLFNRHARGALGDIPFPETYPEIWLAEARDLERARRILAQYERPTAAETRCRACGEDNPGGFELCWRCGAALDVSPSPPTDPRRTHA